MDSKNARGIGNLAIIIGGLLVILAIVILLTNFKMNVNRDWLGNTTGVSYEFPNVPYSIGLGVVGIIFGVVGSALHISAKPQIQQPRFNKNSLYCPFCGQLNIADAVFCSKCGKKLT